MSQEKPDSIGSLEALIRLAMLPGIGPRTLAELLDRFSNAENVLSASAAQLRETPGVGPKLIHTIECADLHVDVESLMQQCEQLGIRIIRRSDNDYPRPLLELIDAPPILFVQGKFLEEDAFAVGIVGTRHPTVYGRRQTERIAAGLARSGITVVSGLARGIDGIAHRASLEAEGRTLAVLGGGMAEIYPPEHTELAQRIAGSGAVISEYPPWAKPRGGMFPQRNRLISGLSLGTCVIEAADRSGALITARLSGEQGRDCFALPGPVSSRSSRGTNQLIRDGAILIQSAEDIIDSLGPFSQPIPFAQSTGESPREIRNPKELNLNDQEQMVLDAISTESTSIDGIIASSGLPAHRVLATISVLEIRHLVRRLSGQYVTRA